MRIEYLEEFEMLATVLNYSKVAKSLHLSTSVLSRHISSLEREVGDVLFERSTTSVSLTPVGKRFFAEIVPVLDHYRQAMRTFANDPVRTKRQVKVMLVRQSGILKQVAAPTAQKLAATSGINVTYTLNSHPDARDDFAPLLDGRADAIVTYASSHVPQDFVNVVLHADPFAAIVPIGHPLANHESISIKRDLSRHRVVTLKAPMFRAGAGVVADAFERLGVEMSQSYLFAQNMDELCFSPSFEDVLIVPRSALPRHSYLSPETHAVLPFEEDVSFTLSLVYPQQNAREALKAFAEALKSACEECARELDRQKI